MFSTAFCWPRADLTFEEAGFRPGHGCYFDGYDFDKTTLRSVWEQELPVSLRPSSLAWADRYSDDFGSPVFPVQSGTRVFDATKELGWCLQEAEFLASGLFSRSPGDGENVAQEFKRLASITTRLVAQQSCRGLSSSSVMAEASSVSTRPGLVTKALFKSQLNDALIVPTNQQSVLSATASSISIGEDQQRQRCPAKQEPILRRYGADWGGLNTSRNTNGTALCDVVDRVVDDMLQKGHFFFAANYTRLMDAIAEVADSQMPGEGVNIFPSEAICGDVSRGVEHFAQSGPTVGLVCVWKPNELHDVFRLKNNAEVLDFVAPMLESESQQKAHHSVEQEQMDMDSISAPGSTPPNGRSRATRFSAFRSEGGGSPDTVEIFVYDEGQKRLSGSEGRVQPYFLWLEAGETVANLTVRHLQDAIAFGHDLAFPSSVIVRGESVGLSCPSSDSPLVDVASDLSFVVSIRRSAENAVRGCDAAQVEELVMSKYAAIVGTKLFPLPLRDPARYGHNDEHPQYSRKFLSGSQRMCLWNVDENEEGYDGPPPGVHTWSIATIAQEDVGFLWLLADPEAESVAGRRNRLNLDNMVAFLRAESAQQEQG